MNKLSVHAQRALERLDESHALNWFVRSDAARNDANCPCSDQPPNVRFNQSFEYYFGSQQVIHAADTLNSYCQSILAEILISSPDLWKKVQLNFDAKQSIDKYIERLKKHRALDNQVRVALRDGIQCYWSPESDVIAMLRNKFVHQNGHDPEKEVENIILSKNNQWSKIPPVELMDMPMPVHYMEEHWLAADVTLGHWACRHIQNHIHLMDQTLCSTYNLPRDRWRPRPVSRQIAATFASGKSHEIAPGQPLNINLEISKQPLEASPSPYPKTKMEDITCSKVWRTWNELLENQVSLYLQQSKLQVADRNDRVLNAQSHTLKGQERHFEWQLFPPSPHERHKPECVCVRLGEIKLTPMLTIWGSNSAMKDFFEGEESAAIEYLKDCIDKTLTVNS